MNKLFASMILFLCLINNSFAQIFNANFAALNFLAANKVHKVGTNGTAAGNVTLYNNVISIGGQQIDCIIRTVSLTNASFTLPGSAPGGTIPFDYSSATGTGMSANEDKFFSPTFNFTAGGGNCKFHFEFILGGSYNNTTNTGTIVTIQNVYLNTYDLDGNGGASTNQYNEFNNFAATTVSTGTTVTATYNATTLLTKFRSNSNANSSVVTADATRVKIQYDDISEFDIVVGADGAGAAYFFLDFSSGVTWAGATTSATAPKIDLNTSVAGANNTSTTCGTNTNLTTGVTNFVLSSNNCSEVRISVESAAILNGNDERLLPIGSTNPIADVIPLGFTTSSTQTFTLGGIAYDVQKSVVTGVRSLRIVKNGGGNFTTAQVETLLDALQYKNNAATPIVGNRTFFLNVVEGAFASNVAQHTVDVSCTLPVSWLSFDAVVDKQLNVNLQWSTATEQHSKLFMIQYSTNGADWNNIGEVTSVGNSNQVSTYQFQHKSATSGSNFYRIQQLDTDDRYSYSKTVKVSIGGKQPAILIMQNPVLNAALKLKVDQPTDFVLMDPTGRVLVQRKLMVGIQNIQLPNLSKGVYYLIANGVSQQVMVQ